MNIDGKVDITADEGENTNDEAKERFSREEDSRQTQTEDRDE